MRHISVFFLLVAMPALIWAKESRLEQVAPTSFPQLYRFQDTCNVYLLRDPSGKGLLIDLGSGGIYDHLQDVQVESIEWILFTHHHREQCQGMARVDRDRVQTAAPKAEQPLFETPLEFRKWYPKLGDKFSVYGASYVRPPAQPIKISRLLDDGDEFRWRGFVIRCLSTPGSSPGALTYMVDYGEKRWAFSGDVMHEGARFSTWFDVEWDYGFGKGIDTLLGSVRSLMATKPDVLLPAHGPGINDPGQQLARFEERLKRFRTSYVRGYPVFDSTEQQRDPISRPTKVPLINRVTPHLYKLSHQTKGKNFAIIISDRGRGLILDCGLFPTSMLEEIIVGLRQHMGLKQIDAFWISHMHGDHFLLGPTLKEKYGAQAWTLERIADKCENPRRYDYAALVSAYGDGFDGMKIDKRFRSGETVQWEGYKIQVDWMPGQTEFGCCLWLELDGKRIAFTGDNIFGTPSDPQQNGHEAVVARNSAILEEGYVLGSKYLLDLNPDIVMGSHSYVMPEPKRFLERYHRWALSMAEQYRELLPDENYEYLYDPYWVSAYPYRVDLSGQAERSVAITVRNFRNRPQTHRVELVLPRGVSAEPPVLTGTVPATSRRTYRVRLRVDQNVDLPGMKIVPLDITLDGHRYGQWFDFLIRTSR